MERNLTHFWVTAGLMLALLPGTARAQALADQALAAFPQDTRQIAYVNFAQLRSSPNYGQIEGSLLNRQLIYFEDFLRSIGTDPEQDVDEAIAGWRGDPSRGSSFFGLAAGRFDPARAQGFMTREHLTQRQYQGFVLGASGPGLNSEDLFFTFLSPDLAAFGHLTDLEALIDGFLGLRATLKTNKDFSEWESELDGSGPEWGISTGKAALALAAPWLPGADQKAEMAKLLAPVRAVLYTADWQGDFSTEITVVCDNAQNALTLARLLSLLRDAASVGPQRPPDIASFLQDVKIDASGSRVEIQGSGPPDVFTQALRRATKQ